MDSSSSSPKTSRSPDLADGRTGLTLIPVGISLPQVSVDEPATGAGVLELARRAESLGYSDLWVLEQVTGRTSVLEPLTVLAYAAAATTRIRLGTSVLLAPLRHPIELARSASTLDRLSGGRLTLGLGIGEAEYYRRYGLPDQNLGRRFDEFLDVLLALWSDGPVVHRGDAWTVHEVRVEPKPLQQPHPPIWLGARSSRALRRAARRASGWMGMGAASIDEFRHQTAQLREYLEEYGRADFVISKRVYLLLTRERHHGSDTARRWFQQMYGDADLADRAAVVGDVEHCTEALIAYIEAGARHLVVNPLADELSHSETIAADVLPLLR
jgi:probable F420-dependent oxidoreductase